MYSFFNFNVVQMYVQNYTVYIFKLLFYSFIYWTERIFRNNRTEKALNAEESENRPLLSSSMKQENYEQVGNFVEGNLQNYWHLRIVN